jgi:hypothetical protein
VPLAAQYVFELNTHDVAALNDEALNLGAGEDDGASIIVGGDSVLDGDALGVLRYRGCFVAPSSNYSNFLKMLLLTRFDLPLE